MVSLAKTAIIYDFDGTLARGNIQECSFIPKIGMSVDDFWKEVRQRAETEDADEILVYMHLMLQKAKESNETVSKNALREHGRNAQLFPGLDDGSWFLRINKFARNHDLDLRHYIISSGIEEMINGCPISDHFHKIYASKYIYDGDSAAWPAVAINYTTKTQYLFRINKGIENHWNRGALNSYMPEESRPIPFTRMIFLGDGASDIPAMKMVTLQGGYSIGIYDDERKDRDLKEIHTLISDDRVNFVAPGNYQEKSQLDIIVKGVLGRIAHEVRGTNASASAARPDWNARNEQ
jgi:phosphoserine phosphatase